MPKVTPFYPRLEPLNKPKIWHHWAGYLAAPRYQYSVIDEYYAMRNSVGLFDTSPLFKYKFSGADATAFLTQVLARDIRKCAVGESHYTIWCDEAGFVVEDGVIMRLAEHEYWLTSADPNLFYFRQLSRKMDVDDLSIEDISADYAILAAQGPHTLNVLGQLSDDLAALDYFGVTQTTMAGAPVTVSRTGFTGDLGYELWIKPDDALTVWDAIMKAGHGYNVKPVGEEALMFARIEAGLLLINVDFQSARHAWTDAQRETPHELGWKWMLRGLKKDDKRPFIGRAAIEAEIANKTSRWTTVGLEIDYADFEKLHRDEGIMPPKDGLIYQGTLSVYKPDTDWEYLGYATSFMYSSLLKRHIAIAKVPLAEAKVGNIVDLEYTPIKKPTTIKARVVKMPFYNPARKTAKTKT